MTIGLTYNGDLSRVRIALTGLSDGTVLVERSTNELFWQTVRGGAALPVQSGVANLDDFEFAADQQNFYRMTPIDPPGGVEQDSITPSLVGRIWLKSVRYPLLNRPVTVTDFTDPERGSRDGVAAVSGRSLPVATSDLRHSPAFTLELQTGTPELVRDMDLILAAGGTMFVHLPPECPVPGGYVQIGDTTQQRRTRSARSPRRYFSLPCRVVAPPGPDVVGTTLTWGTVFALYGDWNALLAANPTWRDLLATVGSPNDLVVL